MYHVIGHVSEHLEFAMPLSYLGTLGTLGFNGTQNDEAYRVSYVMYLVFYLTQTCHTWIPEFSPA
jgi:hypothetical protein